MNLMPHLIAAPILLPLLTAALMLMLGEKHRPLKARINLFSSLVGLGIAVLLLQWTQETDVPGSIGVYLPGNWQVPFGIVLVVDRLSALMLVLTGIIGVSALLFAMARWDGAGSSFHALFQIQMMGLYGAFLTGDLFNLFVFFEVLLAASYGLMLHGSGRSRVSSGLHYISINLLASSLFLIGAALIYGVTGTLNMADLALKIPLVPEADRGLLHAGAGILAVAFLAKAGMWPLNFWLVPAYSAASAPVAAMFAIMTKVGVYTLLRLWTLLFSGQAGASAYFGGDWLIYGGMATIVCAAVAILAAQRLERLASLSILVSAGILLSAIGFAQPNLIGAALFYLVSSTLALSALFLLAELIERSRSANEMPLFDDGDLPRPMESLQPPKGINLDDEQKAVVGQVIPWTMAFLGLSFIACSLLIIGMPPLSGFIGKLGLLSALLNPLGLGNGSDEPISNAAWGLLALLILSGLASLIAFSRLGIQRFWTPEERPSPLLRRFECVPIIALLGLSIALTFKAEPLLRYTQAAAQTLNNPQQYVMAVLGTRAIPSPEAKAAVAELTP
ncbi:multisubunit potassium/proton antiporter, PhaD subunit [Pseudomonas frederiksbergensis]|jgi:multicomponent K+:H+ antiporter subunit D|uniref:Multisubunit potassium/proton antiporter, PhaD subunit n=1 Tax=Pseudomonas frederiksbergensis TaxID=104087 RepID=A0A1H5A6G1_9PSED|nr:MULTISPECIES: monovalent cation/H+ antiporter subunit D [Pseudomonas]PMU08737.1 monovalent cation/H+ antiporter subunit D [Pseudomonas sp. FW305-20]PMU16501.1 monovalent cation/H+ antiporter subunit D [Pseudomonas sp. FW305-122]PMU40768.1 monovalent cation/H+ antiporter subunit D [Pseudomonas sp. FW305-47B]PMX58407.1 monovalent cation/H+ antiporter subunit D [Pseudomonas sp. FW305-33]PMX66705.1 monovalent cation/H+ antiporter subunit D [Pseudomonas sp. FW305-60]